MHFMGSNANYQESIDQAEVVPIEDLGECLDPKDRLGGVGRYKSCLLLSLSVVSSLSGPAIRDRVKRQKSLFLKESSILAIG